MMRAVLACIAHGLLVACAAVPASAAPSCEPQLGDARNIAKAISISVEALSPARVGAPIKLTWRNPPSTRPQVPTYLVVVTPAEVRFGGAGFMALTAGAKGPWGMAHGGNGSRALVPLHHHAIGSGGEIAITPYLRGRQSISWAVVMVGACGEHVFGRGEQVIEVSAGAPRLVVQDRFATGAPLKRVRAKTGRHDLLVFKDRYEVHDGATGAKVVDRAGVDPNFSPAGRFVAARRATDGAFEVFDLVSERRIDVGRGGGEGLLAWARGDSYLVYANEGYRELEVINAIVDDGLVYENKMGERAMSAWPDDPVVLDVDRGFVFYRSWLAPLIDRKKDLTSDGVQGGELLQHIRYFYDPDYRSLPRGWNLGEPLALSHTFQLAKWMQDKLRKRERIEKEYQWLLDRIRSQQRAMVPHSQGPSPMRAASAAAPATVRATARSARGFETADPGSIASASARGASDRQVVFGRLATAGLATRTPETVDRIHLNPRVWESQSYVDGKEPDARIADTVVKELRSRVPAAKNLFKSTGRDCSLSRDPQTSKFVSPPSISQVWRWREADATRYLIQDMCFGETGAAINRGDSSFLLLAESASAAVLSLDEALTDRNPEYDFDGGPLGGGPGIEDAMRGHVFRVAEGVLAIALPLGNLSALVDVTTGKRIGERIPLADGGMLYELRLTPDGRHLVQLNTDGQFFVHRVADAKRVLAGVHVDDEIVVATEEGLYDTTYEGAHAVQVRLPGDRGLYAFHQFEAALRRPGLGAAVLANATVTPPPAAMPIPPTADLTLSPTPANGHRAVRVLATAENGLKAVRIYLDGRLARTLPAAGNRSELAVELPDPGGARWITAVAIDARGLTSLPSSIQISGAAAPRGTLRAVLVGIDGYEDQVLPRLAYAKADARRLDRALLASRGKNAREVSTQVLLDAEATPARLLAALREAALATGPNDTLVVFYAGHGIDGAARGQRDAGLVLTTSGTRVADLKGTAVSWAVLAEALDEARGTIVVLLDACHAGIAGSDALATNDDAVSALFTRGGAPIVVLAGSKGRQQSHEDARAGGGVFTAAVVEAISDARARHDRDRSGLIDLGELYAAVKSRVMQATKGRQTPWLARNGLVGEMALF